MKVILLDPAKDELNSTRDYYLQHASPQVAAAFITEFDNIMTLILERPEIGKTLSKRLRILTINKFPYSVIYRIVNDIIIVHAIAHQRRKPGYWAKRR